MTRWVWGAGLLAVVLLAACSRKSDAGPGATVPVEQPTVTTTSVPNVDEIPAVIDEAYLNRVLEALDEVDGKATRIIVEHKELMPEAAERLHAIYDDLEFDDQVDVWLRDLSEDPELKLIKPNPGNRKTTVERIIAASPSCVWMAVKRDYSTTATRPGPPRTEYVGMRPLDKANDRKGLNPTAWMIVEDGFNEDGSEPGNPCANT